MRKLGKMKIGAIAALMSMLGQPAFAFLDTGTLLTNSASATYSAGTQGTSVTYSATAKILVANPAVFVYKDVTPTYVAAAGGNVTYTICFSNGGANTAFNVTIKDRFPNNSYFQDNLVYSAWAISLTGAPHVIPTAWSNNGTTWSPGTLPPTGQGMMPGFMQWTIPNLGIGKSGCITFAVLLQ